MKQKLLLHWSPGPTAPHEPTAVQTSLCSLWSCGSKTPASVWPSHCTSTGSQGQESGHPAVCPYASGRLTFWLRQLNILGADTLLFLFFFKTNSTDKNGGGKILHWRSLVLFFRGGLYSVLHCSPHTLCSVTQPRSVNSFYTTCVQSLFVCFVQA